MGEEKIGEVVKFFAKPSVAAVRSRKENLQLVIPLNFWVIQQILRIL